MNDEFYMLQALTLAAKARPSPNPPVGAVVVKHGKVIGKGYHQRAGGPHAEKEALNNAGNCKNATLYVSLEPCSHYGKTPPCTKAIIAAGIARVVFSAKDPNKRVHGIQELTKAGIQVTSGVCKEQGEELIQFFKKHVTTGKPYVILKTAQSLDGKIATEAGESKWITTPESRAHARQLRSKVDAILVGIGTVLADDPKLTSRTRGPDPIRIILDSKLQIPLNAKVLKDSNAIIVTSTRSKKVFALKKKGIRVISMKKTKLSPLLKILGKMGVLSVLIEGGGNVNASALNEKIIDKFMFYIAPKVIAGEKAKTSFEGHGIKKIKDAMEVKNLKITLLGKDILVEATPK